MEDDDLLDRLKRDLALDLFGMTIETAQAHRMCVSCKRTITPLLRTEADVEEYDLSALCPDCFQRMTGPFTLEETG